MLRERTIDDDPHTVALQALAWTLSDAARADRFLALTGIDPSGLRAAIGEPATLDAVLGFLEAHQPDLVACADALGIAPARLIAAREGLGS
jgi:adenine/guanine phosphoribosyltransferase-like PRPP-binding protein